MRVAMLGTRGLPATHGGVERAVEELSARLAARGHRITVFCRPSYCPDRLDEHRGVVLRYLPSIPTKHLEAFSHSLLAALRAALGRYDAVHVHSVGPALVCFIPRLTGKRVVVTIHALDWKRRKWGGPAKLALRLGAWCAVRHADATITVSRAAQRYFREHYGREPVHIPNGVARAPRHVSPEDGGYLLFLGRLVPEKRVEDLIRAFRSFGGETRLLIAGDGHFSDSHVDGLKRLAAGDPRIRFTGAVYGEAKEDLLARASVLVNPSDLEGHPIVLLEALGHGVPVLASDIEEHREILDDPRSPVPLGLLFRTGDWNDLAARIPEALALGRDVEARRGRGDHVAASYDWDRLARETERIYQRPAGRASEGWVSPGRRA